MNNQLSAFFTLTDEFGKIVRRYESFESQQELADTIARLKTKYETVEYTTDDPHVIAEPLPVYEVVTNEGLGFIESRKSFHSIEKAVAYALTDDSARIYKNGELIS